MNTHVPGRDLQELSALMFEKATQWEGKGCRLPSHLALYVRQEISKIARQGRPMSMASEVMDGDTLQGQR